MDQASNQSEFGNAYASIGTNDTVSSLSLAEAEEYLSTQTLPSSRLTTPLDRPISSVAQRPEGQIASATEVSDMAGRAHGGDNSNEEGEDDDEDANLTSSGRRSRSHIWPPVSDPTPTVRQPIIFERRTIGHTGRNSGRNLMAVFAGGDGIPRTRYRLLILRGRSLTYLPKVKQYPGSDTSIPGGLTLAQICQSYPRHVWGTGLRLFIAEGWTGEQIFNALPAEFRDSRAVQRPWNYIQQGFTREVRRINDEDNIMAANPPTTRKRAATDAGFDDHPPNLHPTLRTNATPSWSTGPRQMDPPLHITMRPTTQHLLQLHRQAELDRQERLLLGIMALRSRYWQRPREERILRARRARVLLLRRIGVELDMATGAHLRGLTIYLEEEFLKARQQAQV